MLENLIGNAVEHGGSKIRVRVGELTDGFYVEDDGHGISAEDREDVFEAGYTGSSEGSGFGLSIATEIVEAHGWQIRLCEGSRGGARFEIRGVEFANQE